MSVFKYIPRSDFVIFELVEFGKTRGGVALPQASQAGTRNIVRAVGPAVKDIKVGDEIHVMGHTDPPNMFVFPRESKMAGVREQWVVCVVRGDE